jgi:hypothetical protein
MERTISSTANPSALHKMTRAWIAMRLSVFPARFSACRVSLSLPLKRIWYLYGFISPLQTGDVWTDDNRYLLKWRLHFTEKSKDFEMEL